jgi:hypothetical protein
LTVPLPAEAKVMLPGFAFASAMYSCRFFAGTAGFTTSTWGLPATSETGAVSLSESNESLPAYSVTLDAKLLVCISSVYPSGAARTSASVATIVFAPGRFSTRTCWPIVSVIFPATIRARMSVPPPGVNGTMTFTGRFGYGAPCPWAGPAAARAAASAAPAMVVSFTCCLLVVGVFLFLFFGSGHRL